MGVSPTAAAVPRSPADAELAMELYQISEEDVLAVQHATCGADMDKATRYKLQAAHGRALKKPTACPAWVLRWAEAKKDKKG
eukprot:15438996-Heterocapsa_arctica.AAC.1